MMLRQGVTKRGDAINATDLSNHANHHAAVHSILKNRQIKVASEPIKRSKSVSRREGGLSSSLTRQRSRSRSDSARKLGRKGKSKNRSQSQPPRSQINTIRENKGHEDSISLLKKLEKNSPHSSLPTDCGKNTLSARCKSERDWDVEQRPSRGRDTGARQMCASALVSTSRSARGASLNRYSNFLRRGRSASAKGREDKNKSLIRYVSSSRILHSHQEAVDTSKEHSRDEVAPYDAIVLRENSFESFQSSLTGDLEMTKPRSKSLIRSAIRHLGITSKKRLDHSSRDQDNDNTQVTESTTKTSNEDNSNAKYAEASQREWNPENTLLKQQGEQLEIIDSDSDEDRSCATRSDQGLSDSCDKLNNEGNGTTFQYDPFHSSEHPMFRTTMQCDEESAASPQKDLAPNRLASSIGKVIGRGRSLSIGRKKIGIDLESKELKQNRSKRSKSIHRQLQRTTKQQTKRKQTILRSVSVDPKTKRSSRDKRKSTNRSTSLARMQSKKTCATFNTQKSEFLQSSEKPRKKKVKCIVCRQRLSKGQCVEHLDLYFCSGSDGLTSCFQCAKCQCELNRLPAEDIRVCNAQVMTNSRGSVVRW